MYSYRLDASIDLHVKEHISESDALRQMATAEEVLKKLEKYPGQILADEVGMGKTFVALAVAATIALQNKDGRPVVIMIPSSLQKKWPRDFEKFRKMCLPEKSEEKLKYGVATRALDFLKFLDDPIERRKQVIFLTHGSLSRSLTSANTYGWIKLAIVQRAMYRRRNLAGLKKALKRVLSDLLYLKYAENKDPEIFDKLLESDPRKWLKILHRSGIDPENDNNPNNDDDPVPEAVYNALYQDMGSDQFDDVLEALQKVPRRKSKHMDKRVAEVRKLLNRTVKKVWDSCTENIPYTLPFLILDEAHHLKNARTKLASLFSTPESQDDTKQVSEGPLAGVFERMLFLTATPFQLGHHELCQVLNRFMGISWKGVNAPSGGLKNYTTSLETLRRSLDESQLQATDLDRCWGLLTQEDRMVDGESHADENIWWQSLLQTTDLTSNQNNVLKAVSSCKDIMKKTEGELRKLVVRHIKERQFHIDDNVVERRRRWMGEQILQDGEYPEGETNNGLSIEGPSLLPFLLAARHSIREREKRPVFAEGIASSYEAFMRTRNANLAELVDMDDDCGGQSATEDNWHLDNLYKYVSDDRNAHHGHPKIKATVDRVMELWERGEKVLVFCHYVQTGIALRKYLSNSMHDRILRLGAKKLGCPISEVTEKLDNIGNRFYKESNLSAVFHERIEAILLEYPEIKRDEWELVKDAIYRYLRTPSFLVRFFPIGQERFSGDTMRRALRAKGPSGESLEDMIKRFIHFQAKKCIPENRKEYLDALDTVKSGYITGEDGAEQERLKLVPNVRLVNGSTKQAARQTLMLTFNTPFFPEVLIASSVMAEGVDLHLNCRYIIHHDLCWNPSTLEQRTGRVDRIGSKGEVIGESVNVYLPFISETQDEKMCRVVMDRERWFKVVMGEKYKTDITSTDIMSERIPLPDQIVNDLAFDLSVHRG